MSEAANYLPKVREQYEEFPYPARNPQDEFKQLQVTHQARIHAVNHFCFQGKQNFENFRVLSAGGGTGDNTILWAEQLKDKPGSEVVYLDMSSASMAVAKKRADIRKLTNVKFINDSLLNLPKMDIGTFDFIDCTGVLHHLKDPDEGLRALKSVLKPGGAIHLMVYAPYARTGVYNIQSLMRLVNGGEEDQRQQVKNTKTVLKALPQHHLYPVTKKIGLFPFNDDADDAGIFDLFLHSQDRAYSILEAHDWLDRCGLKMAAEPGSTYLQLEYLPETFIQDRELLKTIKTYPLKVQQAIGEALSCRISKHEFYSVDKTAADPVAKFTDKDMVFSLIPDEGIKLEELAAEMLRRNGSFIATLDKIPGKPKIFVPTGKFIYQLLLQIREERTVEEILEAVRNSPGFDKTRKQDEELLMKDFEDLYTSLTRGYVAFLRHKSVPPLISPQKIQDSLAARVKK